MKFGGTSVQDGEAIRRVIDIVRGRIASGSCPVVVVSAMSRVTRVLCEVADAAAGGEEAKVGELLSGLTGRHLAVADALLKSDPVLQTETKDKLLALFGELAGMCGSGVSFSEDSSCVRAGIMSMGELMSSVIVAATMKAEGIDCQWVDAREMVAVDNDFLNAHPYMDTTRELVRTKIHDDGIVLTQGFIARTAEGCPAVLGFEGSDYSAAIFGMSLDAGRVEIWTDVDGIRTADPRVVSNTRRIEEITYEEAALMASCGARVLHPMTMEPARQKNIPIYVLNSMNPSCSGTVVGAESAEGPKSIAFSSEARQADGTVKVSVVGRNAIKAVDIVREVAGTELSVCNDVISFCVPSDNVPEVANELHRRLFATQGKSDEYYN